MLLTSAKEQKEGDMLNLQVVTGGGGTSHIFTRGHFDLTRAWNIKEREIEYFFLAE